MRSLLTVLAGAVVLLLGSFAAPSYADELTADERKWLEQCVKGLKSTSDRVMAGAEDAIVRLGADALAPLVPMLGTLDPADDFDWAGLGRALAGIGATASADALEAARAKWPRNAQARLATLVADLRAGKIGPRRAAAPPGAGPAAAGPAGAPAPDDPNVEAKVRALLAEYDDRHSMGSDDPQIRAIVAFGRAAVPSLLRFLTEHPHRDGMATSAAQTALERVVTEADIPAVAKALADGALDAASCLKKFKSPAARDALLDVVTRGFVSYAVLEGLTPHAADDKVRKALIAWVGTHGTEFDYNVGAVARFLAEHGVTDAAPVLLPLVQLRGDALRNVAAALAALGAKEGIPALISILESPDSFDRDDYDRHEAGKELNRVVGEAWYVGRYEPGQPSNGNFAEAAKKFRAWWDANGARLKFDPATRRWRVP